MEHLSDDELIASFMGATMTKRFYAGANHIGYKFPGKGSLDWWVEYDRNWDWLMPVVEKIESLGYTVEIANSDYQIRKTGDTEAFIFHYGPDRPKIEAVYEAVVEFIKWYNKQSN